jgi:tRNA(Ile)-lysidine synthase TilS/MesJ
MYTLIKLCLADVKSSARGELWQLYDHIAAQPIRRLIVRAGFDATDADMVANECFESLWEDGFRRLRSFRGETEIELLHWLVRLAINYSHDWIKHHWRTRKRERRALKAFRDQSHDGLTETQIQAILDDLEAILSHENVERLRKLAGLSTTSDSEAEPSERTRRQWKHDLLPELTKYLGLSDRRNPSLNKGEREKHEND